MWCCASNRRHKETGKDPGVALTRDRVRKFAQVVALDCARTPVLLIRGSDSRPVFDMVRRAKHLFFFEALHPDRRVAWRMAAMCTVDATSWSVSDAIRRFCVTDKHHLVSSRGYHVQIDLRSPNPTLSVKKRFDLLVEGAGSPTKRVRQLWMHILVSNFTPFVASTTWIPVPQFNYSKYIETA